MYKLLLVDDEYLELEMLTRHIDWRNLGFIVIGTAKNGQDALEKALALRPDVVITDIKMPIMDGIEFAQQLHAKRPDVKIVFLSGYNQFDYLRAAFGVDALDYLLKPLDLDEIPPLMEKVKLHCAHDNDAREKERALAVEAVRRAVLQEQVPESADEFLAQCRLCSCCPALDGHFYIALAVVGEYSFWRENSEEGPQIIERCRTYILHFAKQYHATALLIQPHTYLLLSEQPITPESRDWTEEDRGLWATICCRKSPVPAEEIPAVYARLDRLRHWWVTHRATRPFLYEEEMMEAASQEEKREDFSPIDIHLLLQHLQNGDQEETNAWVMQYYAHSSSEASRTLTVNLFDFLYESLILPSKTLRSSMEDKASLYARFFRIESTAVLEGMVCHYLHDLMNHLQQMQSDPAQMIVEHIKKFIRTNYAQSLTIESLVEKFYFSPNYLRSMFKKYTGNTVLEYITQVRLQEAEKLLRVPGARVCQISAQVGYSNPSYFCLLFSKRYGMTPNQYRNRLG